MKEYRTSIDIDAPPERVWSIMRDVERWHEWTSTITSIRRLDDGPMKAGSRARVVQPKLMPATWQVTEWQENRGFAWASHNPGVHVLGTHWIEKRGQGSRVTLSVQYSGWLGPLFALMLDGITARYIAIEAAGLQQRSTARVASGFAN